MEGATLPSAVEQLGSAATVRKLEGVEEEMAVKELKKINKQLVKLVNLKKQDNLMAGLFYFCVISLSFVYLLIISSYTCFVISNEIDLMLCNQCSIKCNNSLAKLPCCSARLCRVCKVQLNEEKNRRRF